MKKFVLSVILVTTVGLGVVYGEVEAVKIGYQIRQNNIQKLELTNRLKLLEYQVATLKTPQRLEKWMGHSRLTLTNSKTLKVAKVETPAEKITLAERARKGPIQFARLFMGTAQADSER